MLPSDEMRVRQKAGPPSAIPNTASPLISALFTAGEGDAVIGFTGMEARVAV
jgi:hypothetical protein